MTTEAISFSDEVFVDLVVQHGLVEKVLADATLEALQRRLRENPDIHVWDIMVEQGMVSASESQALRQEWTQGKLPSFEGYTLLRLLGEGSMGKIYEAIQTKFQRKVAVKILSKESAQNSEFLARFKKEANAAAILNHPNIVQAYDVGEYLGWHFLVMEFVQGKDLRTIFDKAGPLPVNKVLKVAKEIAKGLEYASEHMIIHRDIRPGNIMVTENEEIKITDFGLVKKIGEEGNMSLTMAGSIVGNPNYIAPEQAIGDSNVDLDVRSDIYSLGVTMYELLAGRLPFTGTSPMEVLSQHLEAEPPKITSFRKDIPEGVESLVHKMMARAPENRYQSPRDLVETINEILGGGGSPSQNKGTRKFTQVTSKVRTGYYIANQKVMYGACPSHGKPIKDIFLYFLKVGKKLYGVLYGALKNVNLFASSLEANRSSLEHLNQTKEEDAESIEKLVDSYRILYSLTLQPLVQNMLAPDLLNSTQKRVSTYFAHLSIYLHKLGLPAEMCDINTVTPDISDFILVNLGLKQVATPAPEATASPQGQGAGVAPASSGPPAGPKGDDDPLASLWGEESSTDTSNAAFENMGGDTSARGGHAPAVGQEPPSSRLPKAPIPEVPVESTSPSDENIEVSDDAFAMLGDQSDHTRGQFAPPSLAKPPGQVWEQPRDQAKPSGMAPRGPATPPQSSVTSPDHPTSEAGTGSTASPGDPTANLWGEESAPAVEQPPSSPPPAGEPAPTSEPAPAASDAGGGDDGGSWLFDGDDDGDSDGSWLFGDEGGDAEGVAVESGGGGEGGGNWLLGDDAGGGGGFAFDQGEAQGDEQVISLWGDGGDGENAPKEPVKLVEYDPARDPSGSGFIDVKYNSFYKSDSGPSETLIEVRVKSGTRERYEAILVRVKTPRSQDQTNDGKFVVKVAPPHKTSPGLATWYDPVERKKVVYIIEDRTVKGADPQTVLNGNPFETGDREIDKIIKIGVRNYNSLQGQ